ncbi:MAG TPA: DMT family transporter [Candidatus Portnoybacteria bacterium]|nr:DMT family transporter [Candidatus Portnoybacteria bacterium]
MSWLYFALIGYFLYAAVTIGNKYLLRQRATTRPVVFTFWVGLMSAFTFVLAPFGLHWPGWSWVAFDILTGVIYFVALLAYYRALDINEASRAASVVGGLTPVFVLLFANFFIGEALGWQQLAAFGFLVVGGFLISLEKKQGEVREGIKGLKSVIATIILGAIYFVMLKYLFNQQDFITGFVWSRLGLVLAALAALLYPLWRREIKLSWSSATKSLGALMVGIKTLAGFGSLFVSLAVAAGSASLVNALQGAQFAFLFLFTLLLSRFWPGVCREKTNSAIFLQKSLAIILICVGLVFVAI